MATYVLRRAAQIVGLDRRVARQWIVDGIISAERNGRDYRLTYGGLCALAVVRTMRECGWPPTHCAVVGQWLCAQRESAIRAAGERAEAVAYTPGEMPPQFASRDNVRLPWRLRSFALDAALLAKKVDENIARVAQSLVVA